MVRDLSAEGKRGGDGKRSNAHKHASVGITGRFSGQMVSGTLADACIQASGTGNHLVAGSLDPRW